MKLPEGFKAARVSELVAHVKSVLEDTFHEVLVEGEVSNLQEASSGHWYFALSDAEASLSCALFRADALRNPALRTLKDGDQVLVHGPLSVFQKRGTFQLVAKRLIPSGDGRARVKLEALKRQLQAEGLFDPERKRRLPAFPRRLAVITALQGAALQDFLNVYRRRALRWEIVVVPALVQGEKAPASLVAALDRVEAKGGFDAVVLTRGGGSSEDLGAFNDERLVRRVAACPFPVISAVGHQVDWTLCDHAADVRCETPTAAAETLTQPQTAFRHRLDQARGRLGRALRARQAELSLWLERRHPRQLLTIVQARLRENAFRLDDLERRLGLAAEERLERLRQRLERANTMLSSLGPGAVLARGYAFVTDASGDVVPSLGRARPAGAKGSLTVHWQDGTARVRMEGEGA